MNLSISIFVLLVLCVSLATIAVAELTIDEVRKFKIAELKQRLKAKGLTCNGCAEKDDYVNLYMSNQNLPDVVVDKEASKPSSDSSDSNSENKNIDEV